MLFAIISDVHANLDALHAVLDEIKKHKPDAVWFLGDVVGYGPEPDECVEVLKKEAQIILAGNHDRAVAGLTDIEYFNPYAKSAIEWTIENMKDENKVFLKSLPVIRYLKDEDIYPVRKKPPLDFSNGVYLVHSSPKEPEQWHYILNTWDAYINFHFFSERVCFVGHSHHPFIAELTAEDKVFFYKDYAEIKEGCRYIVNAGSVGQPRDGNPLAAYALLGRNSIEIKRVSYDIVSTQNKMRDAGLPSYLINRLSRGL